ncbi:hypothetical protein [Proteus mirabilis]|uniref:hypothetical protein n=1 Tax=Proteus mirabilis TaxID=584 RepID=UPI0034D51C77
MAVEKNRRGVTKTATPKLPTINKDPLSRSLINLLVPETSNPLQPEDVGSNKVRSKVSTSTMEAISKITSTNIDANKELLESVPGALRAKQILIASTLSPRNLRTVELSYVSESYEGKNNDLNASLLKITSEFLEGNYKITDKLPTILGDVLFDTGSYITAILSESSLDNVINGYTRASMEALSDEYDTKIKDFRPRNILGDRGTRSAIMTASLEDLMEGTPVTMSDNNLFGTGESNVSFTDNDSILKYPKLKMAIARRALSDNARVPSSIANRRRSGGLEAYPGSGAQKGKHKAKHGGQAQVSGLTPEQYANIYNDLYKQREYVPQDTISIPRDDETTRENVGGALVMGLPSECVVRAHLPGQPEVTVGAYVFLDENGNPLRTANYDNFFLDKGQNKQDTNSAINGTKGIIEMARQIREGKACDFNMREFYKEYERELELELTQRLANGIYGQTMTVGIDNAAKMMMFTRTLRNLRTRVLYLPEESISYIAFDYNNLGIGRSLLDKSRLFASMAMANTVASTLANIASSINVTTLDVRLDENDDEPEATIEDVVSTHMNSTLGLSSIIGAKNPRDVCGIMDAASVLIKTEGNAYYPAINVDMTHQKRDITPPDNEWMDRLMNFLGLQWGVRPELINPNNDIKFAVEHIQNDALFCKEIMINQDKLCAGVSDLARKIAYKSGPLMNQLFDTIMENKSKWSPSTKGGKEQLRQFKENNPDVANDDEAIAARILTNFLNSLEVTLPSPDITDSEEFSRAYDAERTFAENIITDYYTDEVLSKVVDGGEDAYNSFRSGLVSAHMRKWMHDSGNSRHFDYLSELGDGSNKSVDHLTSIVGYNETAINGVIEFVKLANKAKRRLQPKLDKVLNDEPDDDDANSGENSEETGGLPDTGVGQPGSDEESTSVGGSTDLEETGENSENEMSDSTTGDGDSDEDGEGGGDTPPIDDGLGDIKF